MSILEKKSLYGLPEVKLVVDSLALFPDQVEQSWKEVSELPIGKGLRDPENVVIAGMGGSALGAEVLKDLEFDMFKRPLEVVRGYHLPSYVGDGSLVILSSYSGNTEEMLSAAREAVKKTKRIFIFTTGGKLSEFAEDHNLLVYDPATVFNPSELPRLSLGYSLTMLLSLLSRLSLLRMNNRRLTSMVRMLRDRADSYSPFTSEDENPAKRLAVKLADRSPVLVSGGHLFGASMVARNMFHETGKTFASAYPFPELNHHLLESLSFPREVVRRLTFLFLVSRFDHKEIKRRMRITARILERRNVPLENVAAEGKSSIEEVYWLIQFFGYVSFYLAVLYGVDPRQTPWVDYLKKALKKSEELF